MAWLSGITNKAEELLNKLDENAAQALKREKHFKKFKDNDCLTIVTTTDGMNSSSSVLNGIYEAKDQQLSNTPSTTTLGFTNPATQLSVSGQSSVKSSPSHSSLKNNVDKNSHNSDEELIKFLNSSSNTNGVTSNENEVAVTRKLTKDSVLQNDNSIDNQHMQNFADLNKENQMLKNEIRTVNNEMSLLMHRTKAAEKESDSQKLELQESQSLISKLQSDLNDVRLQLASDDERLHSLKSENDRLSSNLTKHTESTVNENVQMKSSIEDFQQLILKNQLKETTLIAELATLKDRLRTLEEEKIRLDCAKRDLEEQNQINLQRLSDLNSEFDQYRTRAQRTLSNKEQLISELRKSTCETTINNIVEMELQQIREEKASLNEECQRLMDRLETTRNDLANAERKLEMAKEESLSIQLTLQESLLQEQKRREVAEEDCRSQNEDLNSIRQELSRQISQLNARLKERDQELTRLRTQLTQRPTSLPDVPLEMEARLNALTSSLVQKQTNVEVLTSEKNALRLQLEKTEHKYKETVKLLNQIQGKMFNVNDTDDAKAQVPSFLIESPFDTGVTRRVKRAYSSLDAVGIRTSVFLRRYPLARILIMFYVVLLHLWVFFVLFSNTPAPDSVTVN